MGKITMSKEKKPLFDIEEFSTYDYAKQIYEREHKNFKIKLICTIISITSTIAWLLEDVIGGSVLGFLLLVGMMATIISSPKVVLRTAARIIYYGWYIMPYPILDMLGALVGFLVAFGILGWAPIIYCLLGLYQSYRTMREAKLFMNT